jgi:NAD(P)-dependent dehydrogenase (short-subunit alcohol dehydrogenase family)
LEAPEKLSEANWDSVFAVNAKGALNTCQAAYPYMKKGGSGKIIIISSIAGVRGEGALRAEHYAHAVAWPAPAAGVPGAWHAPCLASSGCAGGPSRDACLSLAGFGMQAAYCASKGALLPLCKSLAVAWGRDHINVNCILPGATNTGMVNPILHNKEKVALR